MISGVYADRLIKRKGNTMKTNENVIVNEKAQRKMEKINLAKAKKVAKATRKYIAKISGISYLRELLRAVKKPRSRQSYNASLYAIAMGSMIGITAGFAIVAGLGMPPGATSGLILFGSTIGAMAAGNVAVALGDAKEECDKKIHEADVHIKFGKLKFAGNDVKMDILIGAAQHEDNSNEKR